MTETEWLTWNDLRKFLAFLRRTHKAARTKVGRRKLRLFACACCRSIFWRVPVQDCYRRVVEMAERVADETASKADLSATRALCPLPHELPNRATEDEVYFASWAMHSAGAAAPQHAFSYGCFRMAFDRTANKEVSSSLQKPSRAQQQTYNKKLCGLLRDIFGNPFGSPTVERAWLTWRDGTVTKIAESIYAERNFQSMGTLGDALEEAGCQDPVLLNHCREPVEHALGCWVVEAVSKRGRDP